jgi:hypothetical protein
MSTIAIQSRVDPRAIAGRLLEARDRTFLLTSPLTDEELHAQHDPLMSPILWDLGHIAHFEELWLTRNLDGPVEFVEMPGLFNPFEHPRSERGSLRLPGLDECRVIMDEIRGRVLGRLALNDFDPANPLLRDGYVYNMVLQHEYQHNETILQTLQLKRGRPYSPVARFDAPAAGSAFTAPTGIGSMIRFPGGEVEIGTDDRSAAYDNERDRHVVNLAPFWIDQNPVTNADFVIFIAAGGYSVREYWSDAGWKWLTESGAQAPKYWSWVEVVGDPFHGSGRAGATVTSGLSRVVLRSGGFCPVCRKAAPDRARVGGCRLLGRRFRHQAQLSLGRAAAVQGPGQRGSTGLRNQGGGQLSPERIPARLLRYDRRCLGVDGERSAPLPGLPELSLPGVFGSVLRVRVQGAPGRFLGYASRGYPQHVPQLGLPYPPPDLQRLPVRPT